MGREWIVIALVLVWALPLTVGMSERRDPDTGKIRLLNMGADAVPALPPRW